MWTLSRVAGDALTLGPSPKGRGGDLEDRVRASTHPTFCARLVLGGGAAVRGLGEVLEIHEIER